MLFEEQSKVPKIVGKLKSIIKILPGLRILSVLWVYFIRRALWINDCNNWMTGATEIWRGKYSFDDCTAKFLGSSIASLYFKIVLDTWGGNLHTDDLRLCKLAVHFVEPFMTWEWSGAAETRPCNTCYHTDSLWYKMTLKPKNWFLSVPGTAKGPYKMKVNWQVQNVK